MGGGMRRQTERGGGEAEARGTLLTMYLHHGVNSINMPNRTKKKKKKEKKSYVNNVVAGATSSKLIKLSLFYIEFKERLLRVTINTINNGFQ